MRNNFFIVFFFLLPFVLLGQAFSSTQELSAQALYEKGLEAYNHLDYFNAYEYYHTAIKQNENYLEPIKGLAYLLFDMGQYGQALEYVTRAQKLDLYNLDLLNLEGRIYIGLAEFDKANDIFTRVLSEEPNNIDAKLGITDLDVVYGTWQKAIKGYENILKSYPESIRAMLSLIIIYDEILNEAGAESFIHNAITLYPNDVSVRYLIASHYRKYGKLDKAEEHAKITLRLDPDYRDAALLLAYIYLDSGKEKEAIELLLPFSQIFPKDYILFYTLATAYEKDNQIEEAINIYYKTLEIRNSDEITRHALEQCIIENSEFTDENRTFLANYHFDIGDQYNRDSNVKAFYQSYRKGLQIKNKDYEGLKGYAQYFKINKINNRFYNIYEELSKMDPNDRDVKDQLNIYRRHISKTVSKRWKLDSTSFMRDEYQLSFFVKNSPQQVIHYNTQNHIYNAFTHIMNSYLNINQKEGGVVNDFAQAFKMANENGSDYFFILDVIEKERSLHIQVDIYFAKSGILLDSFSLLETGNHRIQSALTYISEKISTSLPLQGTLARFQFDKGICNLGITDGLEVGDELLIIRKGFLGQGTKGFSFDYEDKNVLGTFSVTAVDDIMSEGEVKNRFYYDLINEGDHIIQVPNETVDFELGQYIPPDLYKELLKLR